MQPGHGQPVERRAQRVGRESENQARRRQQQWRELQREARRMKMLLDGRLRVSSEHGPEQPQRKGDLERKGDDHERERPGVADALVKRHRTLEHVLLAHEAERARQARHRCACGDGDGREQRQFFAQPAEFAHVALAGRVIDDAGDHEKPALEKHVRRDVQQVALDATRAAEPVEADERAQREHGRVCEDRFQVVREQREQAGERHRAEADRRQQRSPGGQFAEKREDARHQKHAELHHRGRV
jgi:hypothetical protein